MLKKYASTAEEAVPHNFLIESKNDDYSKTFRSNRRSGVIINTGSHNQTTDLKVQYFST